MLAELKPRLTPEDEKDNWIYIQQDEVDKFISSLNYTQENVSGYKIYLESKDIKQDKLREAGFQIVRDKSKADVIVVGKPVLNKYIRVADTKEVNDANMFFDMFIAEESLGYKYISTKQLYKYIYKYTGNFELFTSCNELLNSKNEGNTKLAMEFMANANWEGNEIYLMELFGNHWTGTWTEFKMRQNSYKNSVSFRGFLASLNFNYEGVYLRSADNYREHCLNDEHHQWVFDKYKDEFNVCLENLFLRYKLKIDKLEYSIDKELITEESEG